MAGSRSKSSSRREKGAGEHAREAVAEWGKAIKHGRAALAPVAKNATAALADRLGPSNGDHASNGKAKSNGEKKSLGKRLTQPRRRRGAGRR